MHCGQGSKGTGSASHRYGFISAEPFEHFTIKGQINSGFVRAQVVYLITVSLSRKHGPYVLGHGGDL